MNKHYNYGIITNENKVILFNETEQSAPIVSSDFLTDVNCNIDKNGVLQISAYRIIYDLYLCDGYRIFKKYWKHTPHPKEIHEGRRFIWSREKEQFVYRGWVRSSETELVEYVMNNYRIEIYE